MAIDDTAQAAAAVEAAVADATGRPTVVAERRVTGNPNTRVLPGGETIELRVGRYIVHPAVEPAPQADGPVQLAEKKRWTPPPRRDGREWIPQERRRLDELNEDFQRRFRNAPGPQEKKPQRGPQRRYHVPGWGTDRWSEAPSAEKENPPVAALVDDNAAPLTGMAPDGKHGDGATAVVAQLGDGCDDSMER